MSIQIKRGMKKDLPQLKDGELAFCRDTKELYVGNNGNENVSVTKKVEDRLDHDYNAFNFSVKKEMGSILYEILTSPMVTTLPHNFEFLKKNTDEAYTHD